MIGTVELEYSDLDEHFDHDLVIAKYGTLEDDMNISLECKTCGEVIKSINNKEYYNEEE